MGVRVQILGPVRIWRAGVELVPTGASRTVLALLTLAAGAPVSRAELVDLLWPYRPPASAANVLQTYIKRLRRLLEPDRAPRTPSAILPGIGDGYALRMPDEQVDLALFRRLVATASGAQREGDVVRAGQLLGDALRLWRSRPLADAGRMADHPKAVALGGERLAALARYSDVMISSGTADEAIPALEEATAQHPLDESVHAWLIRAYGTAGRRSQAYSAFHDIRRRLAEELGEDPGPELSDAYATLLDANTHSGDEQLVPAQLPADVTAFTGRAAELAGLDRLASGTTAGVVICVVCGTAGVGKIALAADWARSSGAAWLTVDRFGAEPEALWAYVIAALAHAIGVPGDTTLDALAGRLSESPEPVVLVVDNAEDLADDRAHELVTGLLGPGLSNVHLVLLARRRLPLGLGRLLVAGEVTEIGVDELALDSGEVARLRAARRVVGDEPVEELLERTGGLAAAVRLAMWPGAAIGGDDPLASFVRSEIYLALPPDVRDILLRASVVEEIDGDLVRVLTGRRDAGDVMDIVRERDLARQVGRDGASVRVRQPLLGFLRAEARRTIGSELRGLHARAARYLAAGGDELAAAEQAVAARDWGYAARLLVPHAAPRLAGHDAPRLRRVLAQIPAPEAARRPEVAATLALLRADQDSPQGAAAFAALARQRLGRLPTERGFAVRALLDAIEMMLAGQRGDIGTLRKTAAGVMALLETPGGVAIPAAPQLASMALNAVGTAELWAGHTGDAESMIRRAIESSEHGGLEFVTADGLGKLAFLDALSGELSTATERARAALELLKRAGSTHPCDAVLSWVALGLVHWLHGDAEQTQRCLARPRTPARMPWRTR